MKNSIKLIWISGLVAGAVSANAQTVYSNSYDPGDYFTNAGASPANQMLTNFAGPNGEVATYRETQAGGTVGVNTTMAKNGNGSVWFSTTGNTNNKSEIAISKAFKPNGDSNGILGSFDSLSALSADLFTQNSSIGNQSTIVRLELFSATDGGGRYGQLVFDTAWAPGHYGTYTFGQWNNVNLIDGNTWLRGTSGINTAYGSGPGADGGERKFSDWQASLAGKGYSVSSVNAGIGSFNGSFQGGMDDLTIGFGENTNTYNFEAVPEPASVAVLGLGALALIRRRRVTK